MARVSYSVNQHSRCHSSTRFVPTSLSSADADGGPSRLRRLHTGCSDAVYLAAHPVRPHDWLLFDFTVV
ncbi:MAG: hypothetical protein LJE89_05650 [Deltaproteobacteria bacterium]|nr:hypothetical protein [Deltaproteobacteria bacterium]